MGRLALLLSLSKIHYRDQKKILDHYSDELVDFLPTEQDLSHLQLPFEVVKKIKDAKEDLPKFEEELYLKGISFVDICSLNYPQKLLSLDQPPHVLYYKGKIEISEEISIGIIGSRKATIYGTYCAHLFGKGFGERNIITVSGLAAGIDSLSQKATIESGGKTIAVLGSPLDKIYPRSNQKLAQDIVDSGGLLLSEYSHRDNTQPYFFVARNRIIAALSRGLLVIEAGVKSGTLITVDFALDLGKDIFCVPGNINSPLSAGTNAMLKNGALFITGIDDILNCYQLSSEIKQGNQSDEEKGLSAVEKEIISILKQNGPMHAESIAYALKGNIKDIIGMLSVLEIKSLVIETGNKVYSIQ